MKLRKSALLLAAGLLFFAGAASAQPLNISNSAGVPSGSPRIAVDSAGNAHAVWVELPTKDANGRMFGDVYYAMGDLSALQLGAPVKISSSGTVHCDTYEMSAVAVDGSNRVYVIWVEAGQVSLRIKDGTTWGSPITIDSGKTYDTPRIAVTPGGDIFTIYWNTEGHAFSRARVGGVWEGIKDVGFWDRRTKMPDIAVGTNMVGACYTNRIGTDNYQIGYTQRARTYNASWSESVNIAPMGLPQQHPAIRLDSSDVPHIVWTTLSADESTRVVHYVRKSGGSFTSPVEISGWRMLHYPFMNISNDVLYVAWQVGGYGNGTSVDYNIREASGAWKGSAAVPNSNGCTYVDIAATNNNGIVYWIWDKLFDQPTGEIYGWAQAFAAPNPSITLGAGQLFFGAVPGGAVSPAQSVSVVNSGPDPKNWTATDNQSWITVSPGSGSASGRISVTVDPSGLSSGTHTGIISVADPNAPQYLPKTITVTLNVYASGTSANPFGSFDTPVGGTTVRSSVPVTGWALDDIGIQSVKIYRAPVGAETPGNPVFIGDAVMVEGARPDVAAAYPSYPAKNRSGWGYMLLTYFLPNGGNGSVTLYAVAQDLEGHSITLGNKTVMCDNANAGNPFGAIDTPTQGGTASGSAFTNFGWALTPQPASIPVDGSTITVWVDGAPLGNPVYNNYRADIASAFPGYANSNGAVGYFNLNTTAYANGVHTIAWSVGDSLGHADGIGSRYFDIYNGASSSASSAAPAPALGLTADEASGFAGNPRLPVFFRKGWDGLSPLQTALPENDGRFLIEIRETERVEIHLNPEAQPFDSLRPVAGIGNEGVRSSGAYRGCLDAGSEIRPLPIGSFLDREAGVFSWIPGPGFIGDYRLVFLDSALGLKREVIVRIVPKY